MNHRNHRYLVICAQPRPSLNIAILSIALHYPSSIYSFSERPNKSSMKEVTLDLEKRKIPNQPRARSVSKLACMAPMAMTRSGASSHTDDASNTSLALLVNNAP